MKCHNGENEVASKITPKQTTGHVSSFRSDINSCLSEISNMVAAPMSEILICLIRLKYVEPNVR